jgi:hypothetical protein
MPYGSWINELPTGFFLAVHVAAFALGAGFAWLAYKRELNLLGAAFSLFAVAELVYMTVELELAGEDADAAIPGLREHLDGCPACREEHESLRALVGGEQAL